MECVTEQKGPYAVVALSGDVDLHYSPVARKAILQALKQNQPVLVDLSEVKYIDSSGIASLVEGYQMARTKNLQFGLAGVSDTARQVLQLARLDQVFPIKDSVTDYLGD
jgi:anti-sigma B factor antagonist